jgi:hypothetical protein
MHFRRLAACAAGVSAIFISGPVLAGGGGGGGLQGYVPCPRGGLGTGQMLATAPPGWQASQPPNEFVLLTPRVEGNQLVCHYSVYGAHANLFVYQRPIGDHTTCTVRSDNTGFNCSAVIQ